MEKNSETSSDESVTSDKSKPKPFVCTYADCKAAFTKNRKLTNHIRKHTGERPFICDEANCNKSYTNSSHLRRHKKFYHEKSSNEHVTCSVEGCSKEFANKWSLKKHLNRFHNPDRTYPFTCTECKQGFLKKRQLQAHTFVHTGELPFSCNECDAKFPTSYDCNRHKRVHMKYPKYPCECGEVFERWSKLQLHRKGCEKNKMQCPVCKKTFSTTGNLNMHLNVHASKDDKDVYMCPHDDCQRFYFYKKNLQFHIKTRHEKAPTPKISCKYDGCKKLFNKMQNYKSHLLRHSEPKKEKSKRKPRKDKGTHKKSALSMLCGPLNIDDQCENTNPKVTETVEKNK